eukprot:Nk52_evm5s2085 gene=Nk52_evmTU5s2085
MFVKIKSSFTGEVTTLPVEEYTKIETLVDVLYSKHNQNHPLLLPRDGIGICEIKGIGTSEASKKWLEEEYTVQDSGIFAGEDENEQSERDCILEFRTAYRLVRVSNCSLDSLERNEEASGEEEEVLELVWDDRKCVEEFTRMLCGIKRLKNDSTYGVVMEDQEQKQSKAPLILQKGRSLVWYPNEATFLSFLFENNKSDPCDPKLMMPATNVRLRKRFFFKQERIDSNFVSEGEVQFLYEQVKSDFLCGWELCSAKSAVQLAALTLQAEVGDFNEEFSLSYQSYPLKAPDILPPIYYKDTSTSTDQLSHIIGIVEKYHCGFRGMTSQEAKLRYVQEICALESHGFTYFSVSEVETDTQGLQDKKTLVDVSKDGDKYNRDVYVGLGGNEIIRKDPMTNEILSKWKLTSVNAWRGNSVRVYISFDNGMCYQAITAQAIQMTHHIRDGVNLLLNIFDTSDDSASTSNDHLGRKLIDLQHSFKILEMANRCFDFPEHVEQREEFFEMKADLNILHHYYVVAELSSMAACVRAIAGSIVRTGGVSTANRNTVGGQCVMIASNFFRLVKDTQSMYKVKPLHDSQTFNQAIHRLSSLIHQFLNEVSVSRDAGHVDHLLELLDDIGGSMETIIESIGPCEQDEKGVNSQDFQESHINALLLSLTDNIKRNVLGMYQLGQTIAAHISGNSIQTDGEEITQASKEILNESLVLEWCTKISLPLIAQASSQKDLTSLADRMTGSLSRIVSVLQDNVTEEMLLSESIITAMQGHTVAVVEANESVRKFKELLLNINSANSKNLSWVAAYEKVTQTVIDILIDIRTNQLHNLLVFGSHEHLRTPMEALVEFLRDESAKSKANILAKECFLSLSSKIYHSARSLEVLLQTCVADESNLPQSRDDIWDAAEDLKENISLIYNPDLVVVLYTKLFSIARECVTRIMSLLSCVDGSIMDCSNEVSIQALTTSSSNLATATCPAILSLNEWKENRSETRVKQLCTNLEKLIQPSVDLINICKTSARLLKSPQMAMQLSLACNSTLLSVASLQEILSMVGKCHRDLYSTTEFTDNFQFNATFQKQIAHFTSRPKNFKNIDIVLQQQKSTTTTPPVKHLNDNEAKLEFVHKDSPKLSRRSSCKSLPLSSQESLLQPLEFEQPIPLSGKEENAYEENNPPFFQKFSSSETNSKIITVQAMPTPQLNEVSGPTEHATPPASSLGTLSPANSSSIFTEEGEERKAFEEQPRSLFQKLFFSKTTDLEQNSEIESISNPQEKTNPMMRTLSGSSIASEELTNINDGLNLAQGIKAAKTVTKVEYSTLNSSEDPSNATYETVKTQDGGPPIMIRSLSGSTVSSVQFAFDSPNELYPREMAGLSEPENSIQAQMSVKLSKVVLAEENQPVFTNLHLQKMDLENTEGASSSALSKESLGPLSLTESDASEEMTFKSTVHQKPKHVSVKEIVSRNVETGTTTTSEKEAIKPKYNFDEGTDSPLFTDMFELKDENIDFENSGIPKAKAPKPVPLKQKLTMLDLNVEQVQRVKPSLKQLPEFESDSDDCTYEVTKTDVIADIMSKKADDIKLEEDLEVRIQDNTSGVFAKSEEFGYSTEDFNTKRIAEMVLIQNSNDSLYTETNVVSHAYDPKDHSEDTMSVYPHSSFDKNTEVQSHSPPLYSKGFTSSHLKEQIKEEVLKELQEKDTLRKSYQPVADEDILGARYSPKELIVLDSIVRREKGHKLVPLQDHSVSYFEDKAKALVYNGSSKVGEAFFYISSAISTLSGALSLAQVGELPPSLGNTLAGFQAEVLDHTSRIGTSLPPLEKTSLELNSANDNNLSGMLVGFARHFPLLAIATIGAGSKLALKKDTIKLLSKGVDFTKECLRFVRECKETCQSIQKKQAMNFSELVAEQTVLLKCSKSVESLMDKFIKGLQKYSIVTSPQKISDLEELYQSKSIESPFRVGGVDVNNEQNSLKSAVQEEDVLQYTPLKDDKDVKAQEKAPKDTNVKDLFQQPILGSLQHLLATKTKKEEAQSIPNNRANLVSPVHVFHAQVTTSTTPLASEADDNTGDRNLIKKEPLEADEKGRLLKGSVDFLTYFGKLTTRDSSARSNEESEANSPLLSDQEEEIDGPLRLSADTQTTQPSELKKSPSLTLSQISVEEQEEAFDLPVIELSEKAEICESKTNFSFGFESVNNTVSTNVDDNQMEMKAILKASEIEFSVQFDDFMELIEQQETAELEEQKHTDFTQGGSIHETAELPYPYGDAAVHLGHKLDPETSLEQTKSSFIQGDETVYMSWIDCTAADDIYDIPSKLPTPTKFQTKAPEAAQPQEKSIKIVSPPMRQTCTEKQKMEILNDILRMIDQENADDKANSSTSALKNTGVKNGTQAIVMKSSCSNAPENQMESSDAKRPFDQWVNKVKETQNRLREGEHDDDQDQNFPELQEIGKKQPSLVDLFSNKQSSEKGKGAESNDHHADADSNVGVFSTWFAKLNQPSRIDAIKDVEVQPEDKTEKETVESIDNDDKEIARDQISPEVSAWLETKDDANAAQLSSEIKELEMEEEDEEKPSFISSWFGKDMNTGNPDTSSFNESKGEEKSYVLNSWFSKETAPVTQAEEATDHAKKNNETFMNKIFPTSKPDDILENSQSEKTPSVISWFERPEDGDSKKKEEWFSLDKEEKKRGGWLSSDKEDEKKGGWFSSDKEKEKKGGWFSSDKEDEKKGGWFSSDKEKEKKGGWFSSDKDEEKKSGWFSSDKEEEKKGGWFSSDKKEEKKGGWFTSDKKEEKKGGWFTSDKEEEKKGGWFSSDNKEEKKGGWFSSDNDEEKKSGWFSSDKEEEEEKGGWFSSGKTTDDGGNAAQKPDTSSESILGGYFAFNGHQPRGEKPDAASSKVDNDQDPEKRTSLIEGWFKKESEQVHSDEESTPSVAKEDALADKSEAKSTLGEWFASKIESYKSDNNLDGDSNEPLPDDTQELKVDETSVQGDSSSPTKNHSIGEWLSSKIESYRTDNAEVTLIPSIEISEVKVEEVASVEVELGGDDKVPDKREDNESIADTDSTLSTAIDYIETGENWKDQEIATVNIESLANDAGMDEFTSKSNSNEQVSDEAVESIDEAVESMESEAEHQRPGINNASEAKEKSISPRVHFDKSLGDIGLKEDKAFSYEDVLESARLLSTSLHDIYEDKEVPNEKIQEQVEQMEDTVSHLLNYEDDRDAYEAAFTNMQGVKDFFTTMQTLKQPKPFIEKGVDQVMSSFLSIIEEIEYEIQEDAEIEKAMGHLECIESSIDVASLLITLHKNSNDREYLFDEATSRIINNCKVLEESGEYILELQNTEDVEEEVLDAIADRFVASSGLIAKDVIKAVENLGPSDGSCKTICLEKCKNIIVAIKNLVSLEKIEAEKEHKNLSSLNIVIQQISMATEELAQVLLNISKPPLQNVQEPAKEAEESLITKESPVEVTDSTAPPLHGFVDLTNFNPLEPEIKRLKEIENNLTVLHQKPKENEDVNDLIAAAGSMTNSVISLASASTGILKDEKSAQPDRPTDSELCISLKKNWKDLCDEIDNVYENVDAFAKTSDLGTLELLSKAIETIESLAAVVVEMCVSVDIETLWSARKIRVIQEVLNSSIYSLNLTMELL